MSKGIIYCITCAANGKKYVGSTTQGMAKRWWEHQWLLNRHQHHSAYLQRAWDKYGADTFNIVLLEEPELNVLDVREAFWIDFLGSHVDGFNHGPTGGRRGAKASEETKQTLSASQKFRWTERGNELRAMRKEWAANRSPEEKAKQAEVSRKNLKKAVASPNRRPPPKTSEMPKEQQLEIYKKRQATCKATWEAKDGKDGEIRKLVLANWAYTAIAKELHTSLPRIRRVVREMNVD